jgi:hypothetical protein
MAPSRIPTLFQRIRPIWGVIVGFSAVIGTLVTVIALQQARSSDLSSEAAQATVIFIQARQLTVQVAVATFQSEARDIQTGPTATAIAERVAALQSTADALDVARQQVEVALTAPPASTTVASATPAAPDATPEGLPVPDMAGLSVALTDFSRFQNVLTVELRVTNSSAEDKFPYLSGGSHLLNEETFVQYSVLDQSPLAYQPVPATSDREIWIKYRLPEDENPRYLTLVLGHGVLFEHLEVPPSEP